VIPAARVLLAAVVAALLLAPRGARADVVHQVRTGETLASIAVRYYGDANREAVLVAANVLGAQTNTSILPGMRIVVPSVSYYRVAAGDSWQHIATSELGSPSRAGYLAHINGQNFMVPPSAGAVLRIPYLLRYVVLTEEPLFEVARRFYGDRSQVQFILEFNHQPSSRMNRGQVLLLPLPDLTLREEPVCESAAPLAQDNATQRRTEADLPLLQSMVTHGQYVEALSLGIRLTSAEGLAAGQRVTIDRALAEAYCALDRVDLAAEVFRDALRVEPTLTLDLVTTPPRVLDAFGIARGIGTARTIAPAPPTARPDDAH
jgi:LysM repeat protein